MADYVTKIRTGTGDMPIQATALTDELNYEIEDKMDRKINTAVDDINTNINTIVEDINTPLQIPKASCISGVPVSAPTVTWKMTLRQPTASPAMRRTALISSPSSI